MNKTKQRVTYTSDHGTLQGSALLLEQSMQCTDDNVSACKSFHHANLISLLYKNKIKC